MPSKNLRAPAASVKVRLMLRTCPSLETSYVGRPRHGFQMGSGIGGLPCVLGAAGDAGFGVGPAVVVAVGAGEDFAAACDLGAGLGGAVVGSRGFGCLAGGGGGGGGGWVGVVCVVGAASGWGGVSRVCLRNSPS